MSTEEPHTEVVDEAESVRDPSETEWMPREIWEMPQLREAYKRMHRKNKNFMAAICGQTGSGKSWGALRVCELIDPEFSIDQVAFSVEEFVELVNDDSYGAGSMIVMDEAGVSMDNRTWYDQDQIQIAHILETWRHQNRGAIWTLPTFDHLDKKARARMHAMLTPQGINSEEDLNRIKWLWRGMDAKSGETYDRYQRTTCRGVSQVHRHVKLSPPSKELREAYEEKKEEFTAELNEEIEEEMSDDEDDGISDARKTEQEAIEELTEGTHEHVKRENKKTGGQMIDKDLILNSYPELSERQASRVKKVVEKEVDLND